MIQKQCRKCKAAYEVREQTSKFSFNPPVDNGFCDDCEEEYVKFLNPKKGPEPYVPYHQFKYFDKRKRK